MNALETLVTALRRLPGVGKRAAQKMALQLLLDRENALAPLQQALADADAQIRTCSTCGNLDVTDPCSLCSDESRDDTLICVVPHVSDLWALERTKLLRGRYHVLGGLLSAINGVGPEHLRVSQLVARLQNGTPLREIIFALPASVEGQSTAHHLTETLRPYLTSEVKFSRLSHGLPLGGHLETMDEGTLALALSGRSSI